MTVDNDTTLRITYDANGPLYVDYNGTIYYYVTNLQGDVIALVNTSGTPVVEYTYDAWGKLLTTTGSMATTLGAHNPLRYRGYVYDRELGLYYLQSRYYNPEMGRFINADVLVTTGQGLLGNNTFAYCNNNPIQNSDDTGCSPYGALNFWDYYKIHKLVQFDCVIRRSYDMEVYVKNAAGKTGFLDLYDDRSNTYYEVKSVGASKSPNTPLQMARYDSSFIAAKRYRNQNITQPPTRGTTYISGTVPYGLYDVEYKLTQPGLIVYDPQINWGRVAVVCVVTVAIAAAPYTGGQSLYAGLPAISTFAPAF